MGHCPFRTQPRLTSLAGLSSTSHVDVVLLDTSLQPPIRKFPILRAEPLTIVHRPQDKVRPALVLELAPEITPSTSATSSTNSVPARLGQSTGKTSLDSKGSGSQKSSENKKTSTSKGSGSAENALATISENAIPVPTVVTVEKAASAKIFFECHYNVVTSGHPTPRSLRRRKLEELFSDPEISAAEQEEVGLDCPSRFGTILGQPWIKHMDPIH